MTRPPLTAPTLPDLLRAAAREGPAAEAFRYRDERLTYRDWDALADSIAPAFTAHGIVFTSGTTGVPKGAWYTHRNLLAVVDIERRRHPGGIPPFQTSLAAGLSFAHVGTMTRIGFQIAHLGALVVHDTFDAAAVLETAERERLKQLGGIPTQLVLLLDHPDRPCRRAKGWWTSENGALNEDTPAVR